MEQAIYPLLVWEEHKTSAACGAWASLSNLPLPENCRTCQLVIQPLRLPIQDNKFVTVISVYTPTLQAETGVKEAFYRHLYNLMYQVDSKNKLLIFGNFNARVERDSELWRGVLGRHGICNCSDNGVLF